MRENCEASKKKFSVLDVCFWGLTREFKCNWRWLCRREFLCVRRGRIGRRRRRRREFWKYFKGALEGLRDTLEGPKDTKYFFPSNHQKKKIQINPKYFFFSPQKILSWRVWANLYDTLWHFLQAHSLNFVRIQPALTA